MAFAFRCPVYPIVGSSGARRSPIELADQLAGLGIPLLQLRMKNEPTRTFIELARELRRRTAIQGVKLIINDRADIASLVAADGVHLGQDDLAPTDARQILGPGAIIGCSTHDIAQLETALGNSASDYLAYGPIFATTSKDDPGAVRGLVDLAEAAARCRLPLVGIGGIDHSNIASVLSAGASAAAVISTIGNAADPVRATTRLLSLAGANPATRGN